MGASESTADSPDCRECQIDQDLAVSLGLDRCCGQPFWPTRDAQPKSLPPKLRIVTSKGGTTVSDKSHERRPALNPPAAQQPRRSSASQTSFASRRSSQPPDARNYFRFENGIPRSITAPFNAQHRHDDAEISNASTNVHQGANETQINSRRESENSENLDISGYSLQQSRFDVFSKVPDPLATTDLILKSKKELNITPPSSHTRYDVKTLFCPNCSMRLQVHPENPIIVAQDIENRTVHAGGLRGRRIQPLPSPELAWRGAASGMPWPAEPCPQDLQDQSRPSLRAVHRLTAFFPFRSCASMLPAHIGTTAAPHPATRRRPSSPSRAGRSAPSPPSTCRRGPPPPG